METTLLVFAAVLGIASLCYIHYHGKPRHKRQSRRTHQTQEAPKQSQSINAPVCTSLDEVSVQMDSKVSTNQREFSYHGVSVVSYTRSCHAQRNLKHTRFLSAEAPALPLENCDNVNCQCRYKHFDDRREIDSERRAYLAMSELSFTEFGTNRRQRSRDRRAISC